MLSYLINSMLLRLYHSLHAMTKGFNISILALIYILMQLFVMQKADAEIRNLSGGVGPIDLQFAYSRQKVFSMLEAYGEVGRNFYLTIELTADLIYPLIYTLLLCMLIVFLFEKLNAGAVLISRILLLPLLALVFDYLENIMLIMMLQLYPATDGTLALAASFFTSAKWVAALLSMVACLTAAAALLVNFAGLKSGRFRLK
jgi:hypothetical protein